MAGATRGSARGVTVMLVGSSAWLGAWIFCAALIGRAVDLNSFFDGFAPSLPATFLDRILFWLCGVRFHFGLCLLVPELSISARVI